MKLYVMRHGPAESSAESGIDSDRALTVLGRERVQSVAKRLQESDEAPAHIVTSPLVRAVQTAESVALVTRLGEGGGTVEVRRELSPGGQGVALVKSLLLQGRKRVLLVGHEPDLSLLVRTWVAEFGKGEDEGFDKAMVVALELPAGGGAAQLRFVLDPKSLRLRTGA